MKLFVAASCLLLASACTNSKRSPHKDVAFAQEDEKISDEEKKSEEKGKEEEKGSKETGSGEESGSLDFCMIEQGSDEQSGEEASKEEEKQQGNVGQSEKGEEEQKGKEESKEEEKGKQEQSTEVGQTPVQSQTEVSQDEMPNKEEKPVEEQSVDEEKPQQQQKPTEEEKPLEPEQSQTEVGQQPIQAQTEQSEKQDEKESAEQSQSQAQQQQAEQSQTEPSQSENPQQTEVGQEESSEPSQSEVGQSDENEMQSYAEEGDELGSEEQGSKCERLNNLVAEWAEGPRLAAMKMAKKYGLPDEATKTALIWHNKGSFIHIKVFKDEILHNFPQPHKDYLEQTISYRVPLDKIGDVSKFDGSLIVKRTKGELSAMCDQEQFNFLALNLANEIATGKRSVEDARKYLADTVKSVMGGEKNELTEGLNFEVQKLEETRDPDQPFSGEETAESSTAEEHAFF